MWIVSARGVQLNAPTFDFECDSLKLNVFSSRSHAPAWERENAFGVPTQEHGHERM